MGSILLNKYIGWKISKENDNNGESIILRENDKFINNHYRKDLSTIFPHDFLLETMN
jgi:hypothetical protein